MDRIENFDLHGLPKRQIKDYRSSGWVWSAVGEAHL